MDANGAASLVPTAVVARPLTDSEERRPDAFFRVQSSLEPVLKPLHC